MGIQVNDHKLEAIVQMLPQILHNKRYVGENTESLCALTGRVMETSAEVYGPPVRQRHICRQNTARCLPFEWRD